LRLFVDDDQVDVVFAAQAVVGHGQQAIGVRWQVDARHAALLGQDGVHEARTLMAEAVVVVAPTGRSEQVVE
jgi:hypothetical protein